MKNLMRVAAGFALLSLMYFIFAGLNSGHKESSGVLKVNYLKPSTNGGKDFINFILNWGYVPGEPQKWLLRSLPKYRDELKFNGVHTYSTNNNYYGNFADPLTDAQKNHVKNLMDSVNSAGLKGVYDRIKLSDLCFGQRVEYEVTSGTGSHSVNDGFCYTQRDNNTCSYTTDSGRTVLYCNKSVNNSGYIARNIFENMQHSDIFDWGWNDAVDWYIRPMMRIKQSDFSDTSNTLVAAVSTYNFKDRRIDSTIIRVKNFRDNSSNYSGAYIDLFKDIKFIVSGGRGAGELNESSIFLEPAEGKITKECAVDFKVYWFGKVDVWFDKMTVENKIANELFAGVHNPKIDDELSAYRDSPWDAYTLFVDELTYSNIPCAKYVYDYIRAHYPSTNARLSCAMTNGNNVRGIREYSPLTFKKYFQEIKPEIFTVDAHEVGWGNYIPASFVNSRNYQSYRINPLWKVSITEYNEYLQKRVLGDKSEATGRTAGDAFSFYTDRDKAPPQGTLIYQVSKARELSNLYSPGAKMIIQPQIHSGLSEPYPHIAGTTKFNEYGSREPTNEEIQAQAMVSLAHGADGLCWFIYQSISWKSAASSNPADTITNYHHGFTEPNDTTKRRYNIFGQDKWAYVKEMNEKLLIWKPTLDKINWTSGYSVHSEGADYEYINDIKSIILNKGFQSECSEFNEILDCPAERYWEMGFFNPVNTNDNAKYFIMVNRRCIPAYTGYAGDKRKLKIKFNPSNLPGFNNWKIINIMTDDVLAVFDKNAGNYVDIGIFAPGEGKLFKLVPAE
jgi:hypothetical protein